MFLIHLMEYIFMNAIDEMTRSNLMSKSHDQSMVNASIKFRKQMHSQSNGSVEHWLIVDSAIE